MFTKRWFVILACIMALLAAFLMLGRHLLAARIAEWVIGENTGFKARISSLDINPFRASLAVGGFQLFNPGAFPEPSFLDIPHLSVKFHSADFFKRKIIHIEKIQLHIREISVVRMSDGATNLSLLQALKKTKPSSVPIQAREVKDQPTVLIDELQLTLGTVQYVDFSKGIGLPSRIQFDAGVKDKRMRNITDPRAIIAMIVLQVSYHSTIGNLGIDIENLEQQVQGALANTAVLAREGAGYIMAKKDVASELGQALMDTNADAVRERLELGTQVMEGAQGAAKAAVGESADFIKETASGLKNLLKSGSEQRAS